MSRTLSKCIGLGMAAFFCVLAGFEPRKPEQTGTAAACPFALCEPEVRSREPAGRSLQGPSDHLGLSKAGLPVEITAEFEIWRKVRDSEGSEGWVLHSLLSGRRTALVAPWKKGTDSMSYSKRAPNQNRSRSLQSNVIASVRVCDGAWCRISGEGFDGYMRAIRTCGALSNEKNE